MAHAQNHVDVDRPLAAVWAFLVDVENIPQWIPAVREVRLTDGTAGSPGAEYAAAVDIGGAVRQGRLTLGEVDAPRRFSFRVTAAPIRIDGDVELTPQGDGTRVQVVLDAPTGGLLALMAGPIGHALDGALAELPRLATAIP